ncbi:MAG: hypothetical protein DRP01_03535 [Archaeoglobales archaeon]|nr:MAG: hypothetical protein DRP01_03535 [Archaeoglobales archaeon]
MFGMDLPIFFAFLFILLLAILPFFLNPFLAHSRGRSILLWLILTLIFSWLATLVLAAMKPKKNN